MRRVAPFVLAALAACAGMVQGGGEGAPGERAALTRVVDGDTIVVRIGGRAERVRFIGIDTPERDECFFREAAEHLRRLIGGHRSLRLVSDVSARDRYGRLLRYVHAGDVFVNARMVGDGYAHATPVPPDVEHARALRAAERRARAARRGFWAPGACG